MGLPCLLSPGLLLLALMPYYYITKKAKFNANNLFGVCGLAALFPLYILVDSLYNIYFLMLSTHIHISKVLMPFTIGK